MHASTLIIAFLAGLFSFFAPCGAVLLPSFFAYTFKKRTSLLAATFWFLCGFMTLFVPVGLGVRAFATPLLMHRIFLSCVGGFVFFALAGLALTGRGLHVPVPQFLSKRLGKHNDAASAYLIGIVFGFTVAGCTAPLMGLALALASMSHSGSFAVLILLAYGTGLASPLLLLAFVAERAAIFKKPWLRGKEWMFNFRGKSRTLHSTNAIAAAVLVTMGTMFIASHGTFFLGKLESRESLIDFNVRMADKLATFGN
jgi:cytochrome c biogenesis protein CcdA